MQKYNQINNIEEYTTPTVKECFQMSNESQLLDDAGGGKFHMIVANLL
jgi:hypothetical protein